MPIYEYRCAACGFQKEHLQKLSEPLLRVCPRCGAERYEKQLSAAGFQLKGNGWYATDFKAQKKPAAPCPGAEQGCPAAASGACAASAPATSAASTSAAA